MISICSLKKSFNNPVLNNFNYTFESKNIYHVMGIGAGKTTLLKLIKGIYVQDFGEIVFTEIILLLIKILYLLIITIGHFFIG